MTLALTVQDQPNGAMQPDLTQRLTRCVFSTNSHGNEACQISAPLSLPLAFQRYDRSGLPHAIVSDGAEIPFEGRIEDSAIRGNGIDLNAFGYQRALSDAPYTALWSDTQYTRWRPTTTVDLANRDPARFNLDTNNRLYIAPKKNATYANAGADFVFGMLLYEPPYLGTRQVVGLSFDYKFMMPANWQGRIVTCNEALTAFPTVVLTLNGSGALQTGSVNLTNAAETRYLMDLFYNAAAAVYAGEDGAYFFEITNLRIVTSTANRVNTTNTAGWVAGANVTISVVSSARMYVGQRLYFNYGATTEACIVSAIPSPTQVTVANIVTSVGGAGIPIQAHVIYADEIVRDIISSVSTLNSNQLSSSTTLVQSPALDLFDELYEDELPSAVLDRLIGLGDNATPPRLWEWGVTGRKIYFRPEGDAALAWYVDASTIDVQRTIEQLSNSAYAVYQDGNNRALRTPTAANSASVARYGITRRQSVKATTTSLVQATVQRDGVIDDKANPAPRFGLTFSAVYTAGGARVPIWLPRAGDTITIRNLPPTIASDIDQIRTFRIARTTCDLMTRTLTVEPAVPLPTMAALIARGLRGQTT